MLVTDGGSSLYWDGSSLYRDDSPGDLSADLRSAIAALHMGRKLEDNDWPDVGTGERRAE